MSSRGVRSPRVSPARLAQAHVSPAIPAGGEAVAAARQAGLRYVTDRTVGLTRHGSGRHVQYRDAAGHRITDPATLARIRRLAIPPAWTNVWICPVAHGHIQATGRDQRGRKQYRYHPDWSTVRDGAKFERMIAFGRALPRIRRQVARDLRRPQLDREKVLAAMVRLLETTLVRIGNEEYAKQNRSFGLSTMRDRHVKIGRGTLHFEFRGKSGRNHEIDLHDPRLARIVRQTQELPGQELFQYLDENGQPQKIDSADVNDYLRRLAGEEFSAKDFRTWAGTILAALALQQLEPWQTKQQAKRNLVEAIDAVARRLGNTPAVCRKCYIHPLVLERYLRGVTVPAVRAPAAMSGRPGLTAAERAVLAFLQRKEPTTREQFAASLEANARRRIPPSRPKSAA